MSDLTLDLVDDRPLRRHACTGQVPHVSKRLRREYQACDDRPDVWDEDELVGRIERTNHVGDAAVHRGNKRGMQKALVHAGTVEVGKAKDRRLDPALCVRGEQQVLLLLAHASLEGVWFASMVFTNRPRA